MLTSKFKNNIQNSNEIIHIFSWIFTIFLSILIIFRAIYPTEAFYTYLDYFILFFILFDFIILNRITSKNGLKHEKTVFTAIIIFLFLDFLSIMENTINSPMTNLAPHRIIYLILFLGLTILAFNSKPLGLWLKSLLIKLKEPSSFIFLAIIFLILCPFFLFFKYESIAEKTANIAYLLLVIGVLGQFTKYIIKSRKNSKRVSK